MLPDGVVRQPVVGGQPVPEAADVFPCHVVGCIHNETELPAIREIGMLYSFFNQPHAGEIVEGVGLPAI